MNKIKQNNSNKKQSSRAILKAGALVICFVSFLFSSGYVYANPTSGLHIRQERSNINGVLVSRPSAEDAEIAKFLNSNNIHTSEEYAQWLAKNIEYKKDPHRDAWAEPLKVLSRKFGDCEDFTFLNIAVLRGYKAKFVTFLTPPVSGHAVCVFEYKGRYFYFDNMTLKETEEPSVMQFVKNMISNNNYIVSRELDVESRKWKLLYKTS
jgi:hypothetical protein